jgi:hypothetical protein
MRLDLIFHLAVTYGSGAFGANLYGSAAGVTIGPVTLPVTGAGLLVIGSAAAMAVGGGWAVWTWQRRSRRP